MRDFDIGHLKTIFAVSRIDSDIRSTQDWLKTGRRYLDALTQRKTELEAMTFRDEVFVSRSTIGGVTWFVNLYCTPEGHPNGRFSVSQSERPDIGLRLNGRYNGHERKAALQHAVGLARALGVGVVAKGFTFYKTEIAMLSGLDWREEL